MAFPSGTWPRGRKRKREEGQERQGERRKLEREGPNRVEKRVEPTAGCQQERERKGRARAQDGKQLTHKIIDQTEDMKGLGICLWYMVRRAENLREAERLSCEDVADMKWWSYLCQGQQGSPEKGGLFPLPSLWASTLEEFPRYSSLDSLLEDLGTLRHFAVECWCELGIIFCNNLFNFKAGIARGIPNKSQKNMLDSIFRSTEEFLRDDCRLSWKVKDCQDDFSKKSLSYTGEEIAKAEPLSVDRIVPALPPEGHGGCVECVEWLEGYTRWLLLHPEECLVEDVGQKLPKLHAKVHIAPGERMEVARLLVKRGICAWVPEDKVLRYRGQKVLNGLFGVPKAKKLDTGECVLRCIMNLIPSNSVMRSIKGKVGNLPNICQWLQITLAEGEEVAICQSDMCSAFYLFQLPQQWTEMLCFNLSFTAKDLGLQTGNQEQTFYLACRVLPMGWSNAVGVMQFIAEEVLLRGGLPASMRIKRDTPLPAWMVHVTKTAEAQQKVWWHVYLDNFASGEKVLHSGQPNGHLLQTQVEELWDKAGILCSPGKSVTNAKGAVELGAFVGGNGCWVGASSERLQKLVKSTLWTLSGKQLGRKRLQILMGRWVFVMQFRRPAMSHFEGVWECISRKRVPRRVFHKMERELSMAVLGVCVMHTSLSCRVDDETTCSDASMTGGAVARSIGISNLGKAFLGSQLRENQPLKVPILLVSLFNGIGGASRSFDIAGLEVAHTVFVEIHKPANRICSRRWPSADIFLDVRNFGKKQIEDILEQHSGIQEIHLWGGFPSVDTTLAGSSHSLFQQLIRILKEIQSLPGSYVVHFVVENVCSMSTCARDEITEALGVRPYRLDPSNQVPMTRPRFCWTSLKIFEVPGIQLHARPGYLEMNVAGAWPTEKQWITEGCRQTSPNTIYPTCVKAIRRNFAPQHAAGLLRCDPATISRWESDWYRYPPYQYRSPYLVWDDSLGSCRLLNARERETLMGLGAGHTDLAYSASDAKQHQQQFEDEKCSLIGDSFAIPSFMVIASYAGFPWMNRIPLYEMNNRLGMPPGSKLRIDILCPLSTSGFIPLFEDSVFTVQDVNQHLLLRTNHTGSDVRIVSGHLLNPRNFPRQSVQSSWWTWKGVFATAWNYTDQINALEIRSIYLTLMWKLRNGTICNRRIFHLTDSYVAMSILSKGRTSSRALQSICRKIAALLMACRAFMVLSHVDSADNPTDEGSRQIPSTGAQASTKKRHLLRGSRHYGTDS